MPIVPAGRAHRRYVLPEGAPVFVSFAPPGHAGARRDLPLRDLSASGLSFAMDGLAGLQPGLRIPAATVAVGHHRIHGSLLIAHVTAAEGSGPFCGALFYPASDRDARTLRAVIAWLESEVLAQSESRERPPRPDRPPRASA